MKYSNKILLSDMDGTLLNSEYKVSERNREAITYFISEGGRFGIASGRGIKNAMSFLSGIPINFYSIFLNGSILYDTRTDQVVKTVHLNKGDVLPLLQKSLATKSNIGIQIYTSFEGYFISEKSNTDKHVVADHAESSFVDVEAILDQDWAKVLFNAGSEGMKWLEQSTSELIEKKLVDCVYSDAIYYEILPPGSNKGAMVEYIQKLKGQGDVIYAVGNYYNDVEMIKAADVGIFTQNTPEDLKLSHGIVCADCDEDAIADVIYNMMIN